MCSQEIIEIKGLTKKFKHVSEDAVKDISFTVNRNEIFGLLGPNGAGKTTTLSILCGLFPPTSGSVFIDGKNIQKNLAYIRKIVGIVPQDLALYSRLTARENLDFYGHMYGLKGKDLKLKIEYWLEKLDLTSSAKRPVSEYSGGMKRRVNLIAGILHEPEILFLDEPTVGVDVQSRSVIIGHLKELNKSGTTIIYTSHHLAEAETFCTHVCIIDHGRILIADSPAKLISSYPGSANLEDVFLSLTRKTA